MEPGKRPFASSRVFVSFTCPRCGPKIVEIRGDGTTARNARPLMATICLQTHLRIHEEEDRASGTNHA